MPVTQVFIFIIGSAVIIFGAYFVTYLLAHGSQKVYRGRVIQVLDRFSLAKDKSIMLVAVYDKIYLVAFTAGSVTLLDNIDPETVAALTMGSPGPEDKPRLPEKLSELFLARLRYQPAKKAATAEPGPPLPYEAYLQLEKDDLHKPDSFFAILQNSLEKEEPLEGDSRI